MSDISQIREKTSEQNEHLLDLPDPSWKGFPKWGGITAILYLLLALLAMNNASNFPYENFFGVGIMIISIVMLKGVYHKSAAYTGIAIGPVAIIALSL